MPLRSVCDSFTMAPLLLLLVAGFLHVPTATKAEQPQLCIDANKECMGVDDLACYLAYIRFTKDCPHVVDTQTDYVPNGQIVIPRNCSNDCVNAIKKLKSTKKGAALYTCDCNLDGDCLTLKARVAKCLNDTGSRKPSCTMAYANCTGDDHCEKLKVDFLQACNNMISGVKCEEKCLGAQTKLAKNVHGKVLFDCECDGATESDCRGLEANAKQLRCLPGMDGSGKRVFEYYYTDIVIHGTKYVDIPESETDNGCSVSIFSYVLPWTLALLLSYLVM